MLPVVPIFAKEGVMGNAMLFHLHQFVETSIFLSSRHLWPQPLLQHGLVKGLFPPSM